jgi:hypothetical protein
MEKEWQPLIVVLVLIILTGGGSGSYYYQKHYKKNVRILNKLSHDLDVARAEREAWEQSKLNKGNKKTKSKYDSAREFDARFNSLTLRELSGSNVFPMILNDFMTWFNDEGVILQKFEAVSKVQKNNYTEYHYNLSGKSKYNTIIDMLTWMEQEQGGIIDAIHMPPICNIGSWEKMKSQSTVSRPGTSVKNLTCSNRPFNIHFHWVENVPLRFVGSIMQFDKVKNKRNPFRAVLPKAKKPKRKVAKPKTKKVKKKTIVFQAPPDNLKLEGIMSAKGKFKAIINGKLYGNNDIVNNQIVEGVKVFKVKSDEVILGKSNIRYRLLLPRKLKKN